MIKSKTACRQLDALRVRVINAIKGLTNGMLIKLREEDEFVDDANNIIVGLNDEYVYFDEGAENYSLGILSITDALTILELLEGYAKPQPKERNVIKNNL